MRLGNAEDARAAAQHIGTRYRLIVAEFTNSMGEMLAETKSEPYISTVNAARSRLSAQALNDEWEPGVPDSESFVAGITSSTGWGRMAETAATDENARSGAREFVVERHELQQLPPTAMVFTHATPTGRRILLVDANPGIMTLPTAHAQEYEEYLREQAEQEAKTDRAEMDRPEQQPVTNTEVKPPSVGRHAAPSRTHDRPDDETRPSNGESPQPKPNLGPPPERLDFRRRKDR
jgi:hypothetical protein